MKKIFLKIYEIVIEPIIVLILLAIVVIYLNYFTGDTI
jgi:cytochrome c oxidase subunit IV